MPTWHRRGRRHVLVVGLLLWGAAGCADRNAVRVTLMASAPDGFPARSLELRAEVAGPLDGLRYKWYSGTGQLLPQDTEEPTTTFTFADATSQDRVSVDVWRANARVAHAELVVRLDDARAGPATVKPGDVTVDITLVPPLDSAGGPLTRDSIAGTVVGVRSPGYRVVVYARADVWYIQPHPNTLHMIENDGRWGTWTHTGSSYAVLVVGAGFNPLPRYDLLPPLGGSVVGRVVVEGRH
jgi:hypothetical protein